MARIRVEQVSSIGPSRQAESRKPIIRVKQLSISEYIESKVGGELLEKLTEEYNRIVKYDTPALAFRKAVKDVFSLRTKFYDTRLDRIIFSLQDREQVMLCDLNDVSIQEYGEIGDAIEDYYLLINEIIGARREGRMPENKAQYDDFYKLLEDISRLSPDRSSRLEHFLKYATNKNLTDLCLKIANEWDEVSKRISEAEVQREKSQPNGFMNRFFVGRKKDGDIQMVGSITGDRDKISWTFPFMYRELSAIHGWKDFEVHIETDNAVYVIDNFAGTANIQLQLDKATLTTNSSKGKDDMDMIGYKLKKDVSSYSHIVDTSVYVDLI